MDIRVVKTIRDGPGIPQGTVPMFHCRRCTCSLPNATKRRITTARLSGTTCFMYVSTVMMKMVTPSSDLKKNCRSAERRPERKPHDQHNMQAEAGNSRANPRDAHSRIKRQGGRRRREMWRALSITASASRSMARPSHLPHPPIH